MIFLIIINVFLTVIFRLLTRNTYKTFSRARCSINPNRSSVLHANFLVVYAVDLRGRCEFFEIPQAYRNATRNGNGFHRQLSTTCACVQRVEKNAYERVLIPFYEKTGTPVVMPVGGKRNELIIINLFGVIGHQNLPVVQPILPLAKLLRNGGDRFSFVPP